MYVVIFKAIIKNADSEYNQTALMLRDLATTKYNCIHIDSTTTNHLETTKSYWNSMEDISRWKLDPLHVKAQKKGLLKWYQSFEVEIKKEQNQGKTFLKSK